MSGILPLTLQIDWGINPKPGPHLTPEFTILGLNTTEPPLIHFPLDSRIRCENWNPAPVPERHSGGWRFYQPLRLEEPGQYLMKIMVIDRSPGHADPHCYRCDFRVTVGDPLEVGHSRTLEISADGLLTANLPNLERFHHVKINAGQNALLNTHGHSELVDKVAAILQPKKAPPEVGDRPVTSFTFVLAEESVKNIPYINVPSPKTYLSRGTLVIPNRPPIRLICGRDFTFGREVPEENRVNDVPLELSPAGPGSPDDMEAFAILTKLFSRDHARLEMKQDGIRLFDDRKSGMNEGVLVDQTPIPQNNGPRNDGVLLFPHDNGSDKPKTVPKTVLFSKILALTLTPYYECLQDRSPELLPTSILKQIYSHEEYPESHVSAMSLRREKYLKQHEHAESLKNALCKTSLANSSWLSDWLNHRKYPDPIANQMEYLLINTSATLGGDRNSVLLLPGEPWRDVHLRILNINTMLYLENLGDHPLNLCHDKETDTELLPFRPISIRPGSIIRRGVGSGCGCEEIRFEASPRPSHS